MSFLVECLGVSDRNWCACFLGTYLWNSKRRFTLRIFWCLFPSLMTLTFPCSCLCLSAPALFSGFYPCGHYEQLSPQTIGTSLSLGSGCRCPIPCASKCGHDLFSPMICEVSDCHFWEEAFDNEIRFPYASIYLHQQSGPRPSVYERNIKQVCGAVQWPGSRSPCSGGWGSRLEGFGVYDEGEGVVRILKRSLQCG